MSARFCGACGSPLAPDLRFCTSCGEPVGGPVGAPPQQPTAPQQPVAPPAYAFAAQSAPPPPPEILGSDGWASSPPPGSPAEPPRRRLLLVGGLATVLVLAGGGTAAVFLLGGEGSHLVGGQELPGAVSSEPERVWSWSAPAEVYGGVATDDVLILGNSESGEVWAFDHDGEERWSTELPLGGGVHLASADGEVLIAGAYEGYGLTGLSADDGKELWTFDEGYTSYLHDDVVVWGSEEEIGALDLATGEELWRHDGSALAAIGDVVAVVDGDEVSRLALRSGESEWTSSFRTDEEDYPEIAVNDEMIAVGGTEGATAYAMDDGKELWSVPGGPDGAGVGVFSPTEVTVSERDFESEDAEARVSVHDREGERGVLDVDDSYAYFSSVEMGGETYAFEGSSGRVYDAEYDIVGRYPGYVSFVDGGLYAAEDGQVSYYEIGEASPVWEMSGPDPEYAGVLAADGLVVVYAGNEVTAYR